MVRQSLGAAAGPAFVDHRQRLGRYAELALVFGVVYVGGGGGGEDGVEDSKVGGLSGGQSVLQGVPQRQVDHFGQRVTHGVSDEVGHLGGQVKVDQLVAGQQGVDDQTGAGAASDQQPGRPPGAGRRPGTPPQPLHADEPRLSAATPWDEPRLSVPEHVTADTDRT